MKKLVSNYSGFFTLLFLALISPIILGKNDAFAVEVCIGTPTCSTASNANSATASCPAAACTFTATSGSGASGFGSSSGSPEFSWNDS